MSFYNTRSFLQRQRIPVTIALVVIGVVLFVVDFFMSGGLMPRFVFAVTGPRLVSPIWTPLAYPLLNPSIGNMSIVSLLFGLMSLWWVGGSLERSWGSIRFAVFFFAVALLGALLVWVGAVVLRAEGALIGIWPPVAALTSAWASINPDEQVTFNFVFKMRSRWMALLIVLVTYFISFQGQALIGLFWLLCPLAAWYYVRGSFSVGVPLFNRRPSSRGPDLRFSTTAPPRESTGGRMNPLAWYRRWQERRHLEKLWRNSGFSDKDDRRRR